MILSCDALVAAEAINSGPSILLTSNVGDLRRLLDGHHEVIVVGV